MERCERLVALSFGIVLTVSIPTCLFAARVLGANSNSPPFAPAIGARRATGSENLDRNASIDCSRPSEPRISVGTSGA